MGCCGSKSSNSESKCLLEPLAVLYFDLHGRHDAAQTGVPCLPHFSHAARADGRKYFVWAKHLADHEETLQVDSRFNAIKSRSEDGPL
jgi:hypothetical protein